MLGVWLVWWGAACDGALPMLLRQRGRAPAARGCARHRHTESRVMHTNTRPQCDDTVRPMCWLPPCLGAEPDRGGRRSACAELAPSLT
eukprot:3405241-Prymnesium_polylepis.2